MRRYLAITLAVLLGASGMWLATPRPVSAQSTFAPFQCQNNFPISQAAVAATLVTANDSLSFIYICAYNVGTGGTAMTGSFVEGTGTTCGTNTKALIGGTTAGAGFPIGASPQQFGSGIGFVARTQVQGDNVCLLTSSAASTAAGGLVYSQSHF